MSDVLLILGMHRSGTSAVAGVLNRLGATAPKNIMEATENNSRGYYESKSFMLFHDEILQSAGSTWSDWRRFSSTWSRSPLAPKFRQRAKELFAEEFRHSELAVFKDPRICRFVPFWLELLKDLGAAPHIVIPVRPPQDVALSLNKAEGLPVSQGLLLWLRHVLDAEYFSRSAPRCIFMWKEFCDDWRKVCKRIAVETKIFWPRISDRSSREIDQFLSRELIHFERDNDLEGMLLHVYKALCELSTNPTSSDAFAQLDELRTSFNEASDLFGRLMIDYEVNLEEISKERHELLGVHQAKQRESDELTVYVDTLMAELAEANRQRDIYKERHTITVQERDAWQNAHEATTAEVSTLLDRIGHLETEFAEAVRQHEERHTITVQERDAWQNAHEAATAEVANLGRRIDTLDNNLNEANLHIDHLDSRLAAALLDRDVLRLMCDAAVFEVSDLTARVSSLMRDLASAEQKYTSLLQSAETAEEEGIVLRDEIKTCRVILSDTRLSLDTAEARHSELESVLQNERASRQRLEEAHRFALAEAERRATERVIALGETKMDNLRRAHRTDEINLEAALFQARQDLNVALLERVQPLERRRRRLAEKALSSGLFDVGYYCAQYPEALVDFDDGSFGKPLASALHYVSLGFWQNMNPNRMFDSHWYLERYSDVRCAGMNPLLHYSQFGWREGRDPGPEFQTLYYLEENLDVKASGLNPLFHYISHGQYEGRLTMPGNMKERTS